jgi:hypothetical protein
MTTKLAIRVAIPSLAAILLCWLAFRRLKGLYELGEIDSAIGSMRVIANNEDEFAKSHPALGYTCNLKDVAKSTSIVDGKRNGYIFEILDCRGSGKGGPNIMYHATARPLDPAMPAYCIDQSGILRTNDHGAVVNCPQSGHTL